MSLEKQIEDFEMFISEYGLLYDPSQPHLKLFNEVLESLYRLKSLEK